MQRIEGNWRVEERRVSSTAGKELTRQEWQARAMTSTTDDNGDADKE
jgi:hypothetical protein